MGEPHTIWLNKPQSFLTQRIRPGNVLVAPWGRGVGKSWWARQMIWMLLAQYDGNYRNLKNALAMGQPKKVPPRWLWTYPAPPALRGIRIAAVCDTLQHFRDIHQSLIMEELSTTYAHLRGKVDKRTLRIDFPGGSWFQPFPADESNAQKGRGIRCDVVFIEECDDVEKDVVNSVVKPWFSEPWSLKIMIAVGTPRRGRHGLLWQMHQAGLEDAKERAAGVRVRREFDPSGRELITYPNHYTYHATAFDAPGNVSLQQVAQVKRNTPEETFKREWMCDFDAAEGLVYDIFSDDFHIRPAPSKENSTYSSIIIGVDWGYQNPNVFLVMGVVGHGADARVHVFEEHYETGRTLEYLKGIARSLHRRFPNAVWWADPSRPGSIKSIGSLGIDIRPADNAIEDGVGSVANKLMIRGQLDEENGTDARWAHLYVDPSCRNTLREFHEYRRKRDPDNRDLYLEKIEDKNNHAMDALRYGIFNTFGKAPSYRTEWTAAA